MIYDLYVPENTMKVLTEKFTVESQATSLTYIKPDSSSSSNAQLGIKELGKL